VQSGKRKGRRALRMMDAVIIGQARMHRDPTRTSSTAKAPTSVKMARTVLYLVVQPFLSLPRATF
jgi:hypothetical protein